ncbi:helix-turn-helix transcriptional regulator [Terrabacter aeriphilus]|uniref:Helix-turn-helix transcriptional regulator n=1 Tax=Terrabacter aeriphilus TaxID=515662 RepID=A0ABP9JMR2_9MICO
MSGTRRSPGPAVAASRLRSRLASYRVHAGLTQKDVAKTLDWSDSKLHRIENGPGRIQTSDLHAMLTLYGITDEDERQAMISLGRASRQPAPSTRYGQRLDPKFVEFLDYEAFADRYFNYQTKLVPGVIQIAGYADAIATNLRFMPDEDEAAAVVDARNERAQYLTGPNGPTAEFIIDEGALHRAIGGESMAWDYKYEVMNRLFEHLNRLNTRGNTIRTGQSASEGLNPDLSIQIVPFEVGAYAALRGPFVALEFDDPNDESLVYLENPDKQDIIRDPLITAQYRTIFDDLQARIPGPDHTAEILEYIRSEFKARHDAFPVRTPSIG